MAVRQPVSRDRVSTRYEDALAASEPLHALREAAAHDIHVGHKSRGAVIDALAGLSDEMRRQGRDAEDDLVLEVMDSVEGWCSSQSRI